MNPFFEGNQIAPVTDGKTGSAKSGDFVLAPPPACAVCGQPAACLGLYEDETQEAFACNACCGHGNEDGYCVPVEDLPVATWVATPEKAEAAQAVEPVIHPGIETGRNHKTNDATAGHTPQVADALGPPGPARRPGAAESGQAGPTATMATLALRQALAALERGRVDQATEILRRAVAAEAPAARGRAS